MFNYIILNCESSFGAIIIYYTETNINIMRKSIMEIEKVKSPWNPKKTKQMSILKDLKVHV